MRILILIAVFSASLTFAATYEEEYKAYEDKLKDLAKDPIILIDVLRHKDSAGHTQLSVKVGNFCSKHLDSCGVAIEAYDAAGKYLGKASVRVANLPPGESKVDEAYILEVDAARVSSYKTYLDGCYVEKVGRVDKALNIAFWPRPPEGAEKPTPDKKQRERIAAQAEAHNKKVAEEDAERQRADIEKQKRIAAAKVEEASKKFTLFSLADGKYIWAKRDTDLGETYSVQDNNGNWHSVKKSDVLSIKRPE